MIDEMDTYDEPRRKAFACVEGFCGALDCEKCCGPGASDDDKEDEE